MWQASQSQRSSSSSAMGSVPERAQRRLQRRRPGGVALGRSSSASPSSRRSHARACEGSQSAARTAAATSRASPPRTRRSAESAAANASRYVSRASVASSGSSRLAASSSSGGASRPRVAANVICACSSCARARSSSSSGPASRHRQQPQRRVGRAGLVLALRRGQRALGPARRIGRQLGGALVERGARRQAAPRPRAAGRALQLGGDVLVEPGRRLGAMPGAAIGIDLGVGRLGERAVDALALLRRGRAVDRGAHERMPEAHLRAELDQARRRRRRRRVGRDPERGRRPPHQQRIADRLGRRDEQQQPRRRRQRRQPLPEALLDAARQRRAVGQPEPARQLRGRPAARQLQQRQRVAARLGHDPIAHALVERTGDHGFQQRPRILRRPARATTSSAEPVEMPLAAPARGRRRPVRPTRPPAGAPRRPAPAPRRRRATARRPRRRPAAAPRPRRTAGSGRPARRGTDPGRRRRAGRTPCRARRAAAREAARGDPRTARRADAAPRTRAPSRTRRPPRARCAHPDARRTRYSSSALLPTPASPRSTSARLGPARTLATSSIQRRALAAPAEQPCARDQCRHGHAPRLRESLARLATTAQGRRGMPIPRGWRAGRARRAAVVRSSSSCSGVGHHVDSKPAVSQPAVRAPAS